MNNVNFVTGTKKVYRLAGNDWYAVEQDDSKVMLVDTDGCISDEVLRIPWTYAEYANDEDADNGQCILNYANSLVDKHFSSIKYAIIPRNIDCKNDCGAGQGKLQNAYMWAMSAYEFKQHRDFGEAIIDNADDWVWTRTFDNKWKNINCAWCICDGFIDGNIDIVTSINVVAPAFYLSKAAINHIAEDGEIILKAPDQQVNVVQTGNNNICLTNNGTLNFQYTAIVTKK